jgi:probable F420-dependent oxidoreductase
MKLGLYIKNSGPLSTPRLMGDCARAADELSIDDVWVFDHVAIPQEDSEGSGGRYVDPLAVLAFLAAATERVCLGTGVLVLPYRPALLTAKWVASIQELSAGRLLLGVGAGWMEAEFTALGVARDQRGKITDATLRFLDECFAQDEVEANGQRFLFLPRPTRPPIFVGGMGKHALRRAATLADGWMPFGVDPDQLRDPITRLREMAAEAGRSAPQVVALGGLPLDEPEKARDQIARLAEIGVTRIAGSYPYGNVDEFRRNAERLASLTG